MCGVETIHVDMLSDKFVCFCKDRSEEKTWDVEKAQDLLANLTANLVQEVRLAAPPALEPRGGA